MNEANAILAFWFGDGDDDAELAARQAALWWRKNEDTDAALRERFEASVRAAGRGELEAWGDTAAGRLALILLLDQLPRNLFRDTPEAFAFDAQARAVCIEGLDRRQDIELRPIQRVFFYLPLEHSEDAGHQAWCVDLMRTLAREVPDDWRATFDDFVDYAEAHRRIIDRFGRFPHRNAILGRTSTAEELEFLEQPGSSF